MCAGARTHCRCTAGNALAIALTPHVSACHCANVLATADTPPPSACHCEPVRTLVWQSVLPAEKPSNLALLRANPYALSRIRPKYCSPLRPTAGETDCHVASLLAMTGGDVLATADTPPPSACHCEPVHGAPQRGTLCGERSPKGALPCSGLWPELGMADFGATRCGNPFPRRETLPVSNT